MSKVKFCFRRRINDVPGPLIESRPFELDYFVGVWQLMNNLNLYHSRQAQKRRFLHFLWYCRLNNRVITYKHACVYDSRGFLRS